MQTNIMSRRRLLQTMGSLAALALVASACGRSASGESAEADVTKLAVGCDGDNMAFDHTTLNAPAGAPVELTFTNHSTYHRHNWVLVNGGDEEATAVYEAALAAGVDADFAPPEMSEVLVHTPLIDSGKSMTISFQAPAQAGNYTYLCTFPGHYLAGMKGTLTVA